MDEYCEHIELINAGVDLHNREQYAEAGWYFERAIELTPMCPIALYNLANNYYFQEREEDCLEVLDKLLEAAPDELRSACLHENTDPREHQLGGLFVKFRTLLFTGATWAEAFQYMIQYREMREEGVKSIYSDAEVEEWINYYRVAFKQKP